MSLYTPAHFAVHEAAAILRLITDYPFATLVTPGAPEPHVSHLPLLHVAGREPHGELIGHMARANPHWQHAQTGASLAIFHGPHAYVSPSWYAQPQRMVPTWNYAAVHARGPLELIDDPQGKREVLDVLVARFEGGRSVPWQFAAMPERPRDAMIGAIVGFRMPIEVLTGKFKLSQNRDHGDRTRVAAALKEEGYPEATATAEWMERYAAAGGDADAPR